MLIKLLPESEKDLLLDIAKILVLSSNALLWGAKKSDELTLESNLDDISIQTDEKEKELIKDLSQSIGIDISQNSFFHKTPNLFGSFLFNESIERKLISEIKKAPIKNIESTENRAHAAKSVMAIALKDKHNEQPEPPKIMLFELFLVALRNGSISNIEFALLKDFQFHYGLEDFVFDDLLERAEALNNEVSKAISIVLE